MFVGKLCIQYYFPCQSLIYKSLGLIHSPGKCISIINFVSIGEIKKTTGQDELKYLVWECNYSICIVIVTLAQTL